MSAGPDERTALDGLVVRVLGPEDWQVYRALRLAALAEAPYAFHSSLDMARRYDETDWRARLEGGRTFAALVDGEPAGTVAVFVPETQPRCAELVGMWVAPPARGRGVGSALVSTVLQWAADRSLEAVGLWVMRGNEPAERLYARHGFARAPVGPLPEANDPCAAEIRMLRPLPTLW